ncbi:MAG: hypothetical protein K0U52_09080 [Gammaproteobacteria bacterium]|nr:hypothetical protein [Gammaproteobacteria bacterium]
MLFQKDHKPKSKGKRKRKNSQDNEEKHIEVPTLQECIEHKRTTIQSQDCSHLYEELQQLNDALDSMTGRHRIRDRIDTQEQIKQLEAKIEKKESGQEEQEFEDKVNKYISIQQELEEKTNQKDKKRKRRVTTAIPTKQPRLNVVGRERVQYDMDSLREEFNQEFDNEAPPLCVVHGDTCEHCNVPMVMLGNDSLLGCSKCGRTRIYIQATSSRIAYGEEVEFSNFSYKRLNHFLESVATFQAKESTIVNKSIITRVMHALYYDYGLRHPDHVTQKHVKEILKKMKANKSYERVPQITARINGKLPPRMTPYQEAQMTLMFQAIQAPFDKHKPADRINFLSYSYCLFKFCELMGWDEYLPCFSLLKGKDKLKRQDEIFKKICDCEELNWEFIPSSND